MAFITKKKMHFGAVNKMMNVAGGLKKGLPWAVSLSLFFWVYQTTDLNGVEQTFATANYAVFGMLLVGYILTAWLLDALYLYLAYGWLTNTGEFVTLCRVRAASYLLAIINMFVGMGGLVVFMKKRYGVPLQRGTGVVITELLLEVGAFGLLALCAIMLTATPHIPAIESVTMFGFGATGFFVSCFLVSRIFRHFIHSRDRTKPLAAVADLRATQFFSLFLLKIVYNLFHGLFIGLALHSFAIYVPLDISTAFTQVIQLVRNLPVAAFGIGVDQFSFTYLFSAWEQSSGQILAFSMLYTTSTILTRALLGLVFAPGIIREFQEVD